MKRCTTETCSITLPLKVEKWQADRLDKRFELGRQLYNTLLTQKIKEYDRIKRTNAYKEILENMQLLFLNNRRNSQEYQVYSKKRTELLKNAGFTEYGFIGSMKPLYKCFRENIDSNMAPVIARDVWRAFSKFLFGNGKKVHFKKVGEVNVLSGQRSRSSIRFFEDHIWFNRLIIPVKRDLSNLYEQEMLSQRIKFCRVLRKRIKGKYQYFVQLVLEGVPALKKDKTGAVKYPLGSGRVGLHMGMRFLTYVSNKDFETVQTMDISLFQKEKRHLIRKMKRSLAANNPDSLSRDLKRSRYRKKLIKSNRYRKLQWHYREICRKEALFRTACNHMIANRVLTLGNEFYSDKVEYSLLARKQGKVWGTEKEGSGCGTFVAKNAPSSFLRQLDRKIRYRGGSGLKFVSLKPFESEYAVLDIRIDLYLAFLLQRHGREFHAIDSNVLFGEFQNFIAAS